MKKFMKLGALMVGAIGLITGFSSCSEDEECCSLSWTEEGDTYSVKACEDGSITYTYGDGDSETDNWKEEGDITWSELKAEAESRGASCS